MDLESMEGVRGLVLRYSDAINKGDAVEFGQLFARHGVWDVQDKFKGAGRDQIVRTFVEQRARIDWIFQIAHGTQFISVEPGRASSRSYVSEFASRDGTGYLVIGLYQDRSVLEDGMWRFENRTFYRLYHGPPDLSSAPTRTLAPPQSLPAAP